MLIVFKAIPFIAYIKSNIPIPVSMRKYWRSIEMKIAVYPTSFKIRKSNDNPDTFF